MNRDCIELAEYTRLYLGKVNWDLMRATTSEEQKLFLKFPLDMSQSYFVYGTEEILNKFRAFYLTRCVIHKMRPLYMQYSLHEYTSALCAETPDTLEMNLDIELLFLYKHRHLFKVGHSDEWLNETVLSKVADRNRDKLVTIILSEVWMKALEASGEFKIINLLNSSEKRECIKSMPNGVGASTSSNNEPCYG